MLGWIREKMAIQKSTLRGGSFFASSSIIVGNGISTYSDPCTVGRAYPTAVGNGS
jgi:hypothetical protein